MKLVYIGTAVAILIALAALYAVYTGLNQSLSKGGISDLAPLALYESQNKNDWQAAREQRDLILNDENAVPNEKALAIIGSTKVNFKLSGDVKDILVSIQELKKVFLDPNLDLTVRVLALNKLAFAYCSSGRDPLAFAELYKDAPFSSYLAPGDPDASARNLAEWSYSVKPTAFAAVRVARWYAQQYAIDNSLSAERREEYGATARKYVALGESLMEKEIQNAVGDYKKDPMYSEYHFWNAHAIAWLAARGDKEYLSRYKEAHEEAIRIALEANTESTMNNVFFDRLYYAHYLLKYDKDTVAAKKQADQLAKELGALKNPLTSSFIRVARNEEKNAPTKGTWKTFTKVMNVSPDFKAAIELALAIPDLKTQ